MSAACTVLECKPAVLPALASFGMIQQSCLVDMESCLRSIAQFSIYPHNSQCNMTDLALAFQELLAIYLVGKARCHSG